MIQSTTQQPIPTNRQISSTLDEIADRLEAQGANLFRVRAYRNAAGTVRELKCPVDQILKAEGLAGLMQLPGIGRSLAHTVAHLIRSGRVPLLERLRKEHAGERIFVTVADVGTRLARRIHEHLGIETLAELEAAANDGRLAQVPGMGRKRIRAVREALAGRFARRRLQQRQIERQGPADQASVAELLDIDDQYCRLATQGKLPRTAPLRFNPTHEAWLPILHTMHGDRHYTALFSNTARAHELGATHDWVVIYRDDDDRSRWTVITASYGRLRGRRIIRGRERECDVYYARSDGNNPA